LLSMEQTPREITWSTGGAINSAAVAKAFGLEHKDDLFERSDAAPTSGVVAGKPGWVKMSWIVFFMILYLVIMVVVGLNTSSQDRDDDFFTSGTSGGSFGGRSSGGGHK
jgi:uncharacterized membrane protein YgcG